MLKKLFAKLMGTKKAPAKKKKTSVKKKPAPKKKAAASKKPAAPPPGKEIGRIVAFFRIPVVAVIKIQRPLKIGGHLWIKGHTTNLKQTLTSMQINHEPIQEAKKGDEVGIKTTGRVRRGDRVYQISS